MKSPWLVFLLLSVAVHANPTNELLAHFRLDASGQDSLGRNPPAERQSAPIVNGSLFLNGRYENSGGRQGFRATFPISKLDYHSFTVALDFYPLSFAPDRNLNAVERSLNSLTFGYYWHWLGSKRSDNANILTGGTSHRWLGFRCPTNTLQLTLNNQAFAHTFNDVPLQTKRWHHLVCSVDLAQQSILTLLDGQLLETIRLPPEFKLNILGAEAEATDRNFSFANYSNGSAYYGHAANLKVFGRALDKLELAALYAESAPERAALKFQGADTKSASIWIPTAVVLLLVGVIVWVWSRRPRDPTCQ